jgi:glutamate synthase domain-containing protein 1
MVIMVARERATQVAAEIGTFPEVEIVGSGQRMTIFKEVGRPDKVAARFGLERMAGTHAIGHTRMATESAVTTNGAHPFTTGPDQCLVHNGSLSNHNAGASLEQAMEASLRALDGFYTFVIGTESGFGVLRDPIACKPAVMAETGQWVAFGTEYRALVDLPGIDGAKVWEPEPAKPYLWELH